MASKSEKVDHHVGIITNGLARADHNDTTCAVHMLKVWAGLQYALIHLVDDFDKKLRPISVDIMRAFNATNEPIFPQQ